MRERPKSYLCRCLAPITKVNASAQKFKDLRAMDQHNGEASFRQVVPTGLMIFSKGYARQIGAPPAHPPRRHDEDGGHARLLPGACLSQAQ
jgi:hypothetical protein